MPATASRRRGVVSSVNGKLQILFKNTVQNGGKPYYINSLEVQQ